MSFIEVVSSSSSSSTQAEEIDALERRQSSHGIKRIRVRDPEERMRTNLLNMWEYVGFKPNFALVPNENPTPLELFCTVASEQGRRTTMEDVHLVLESPKKDGHLVAIFDGHGGRQVAEKVAAIFKARFFEELENNRQDIRTFFRGFCKKAQEETPEILCGSTALFSYFDHNTNVIYTGNVGDSEEYVYQKHDDEVVAIPVSDARNWMHPKEEKRYLDVVDDEKRQAEWLAIENPDFRRFPGIKQGVNSPRVFGGKMFWYINKEGMKVSAFSSNPVVTLFQPQEGDKVILGCDGIWKAVKQEKLIAEVIKPHWDAPDLAKRIVRYAYDVGSTDNLSVIVANVAKKVLEDQPLSATVPLDDID